MILVRNIRLPLSAGEPQAFEKALHTLRVPRSKVEHTGVAKLSVDARHGQPKLVYTVAVTLKQPGEEAALAAADTIERIYNIPGITVKGMFTHFSVADTPSEDEYTAWQFKNYTTVLNALIAKGLRPEVCHASNSAAILAHPEAHLDMVREGIILYGMYPDSEPRKGELKPVLTLKSRVAQVRDLPAGTSISYGRTFISDKPIRTAVITAGYADGHPRRISNASYDMIHGKKFKQVGRICMDMHMIDVTGDDSVKVGDEVTLWGGAGMTAEEVGKVVGTINYELTCLITPRVPRVYINED